MTTQLGRWLLTLLMVFALSGCFEEKIQQELHEPGVYKGKPDPLLQKSGTQAFTAQLEHRLKQVQTDR